MHVMSSVSPANEKESFEEEGAVAFLMAPPPHFSTPVSDGNQSKPPPPPPPPPPPCGPPPPPPPPPPPGVGDPLGGPGKKRRVRSFFWKPIPEDKVKGRDNLWTQESVQQQYQIDVQTIEELFGQTDFQSPGDTMATRGSKARGSFRETKDEVSILDSKRGMNVGIFLKQFKKSNPAIIEDIRHGNAESYGAELLKELLKLLPESEEVKRLTAFRGDPSKLSLVDSFMYQLTQVPSFEVRIEAMVLKEEFPPACESMNHNIDVLRAATKELLSCEELHAILHLVLQAGNILNAGGYAGNAVGFKLSSLLSMANTKANKPGMNLLHFVALEAQKKDEKLLEFPGKLQHVQSAARISVENLDAEFQSLCSHMHSVEGSVQRDPELLQQLDTFLQSGTVALCALRSRRQELGEEGSVLIDFFCEDRDSFQLDQCFRIFHDFCLKFQKAVKENLERELKEVTRHRRLRELEEKRHSWAGGEEVGGAFGMRCSSETDMEAAQTREEGLLELLKPRPRSPLSPQNALGRSGSVRRSRHSPAAAADRQLSSFLGMMTFDPKFTGSPSSGRAQWRGSSPSSSPEPGSPLARLQGQGASAQTQAHDQQPRPGEPTAHSPSPAYRSSRHTNTVNTHDNHLSPETTTTTTATGHKPNPGHNPETTTTDHKSVIDQNTNTNSDLDHDHKPTSDHNRNLGGSAMTVNVERHTLVPGLRAFDSVSDRPHDDHKHDPHGHHDHDLTDLGVPSPLSLDTCTRRREGERDENGGVGKAETVAHIDTHAEDTFTHTWTQRNHTHTFTHTQTQDKPTHTHAEDNLTHTQTQDKPTHTHAEDNLTHTQTQDKPTHTHAEDTFTHTVESLSSVAQREAASPANDRASESQSTNKQPVPVPTNDQPVPVSSNESLLPASTNQLPAVSACTNEMPASVTTDASKDDPPGENRETEGPPKPAKILNPSPPKPAKGPNPKTRPPGPHPSGPTHPVRTLTSSENQGMRRVVPISKPSRGASGLSRRVEKPPGQHSSDPGTTTTSSNPTTVSLRRAERSSAGPHRSSLQHEDPKAPRTAGVHAAAREQSVPQRKPSVRKPKAVRPVAPRPPPEEKMCRSTLRALAQAGGGGGSISAPPTPSHGVATSSALPGFARNTAASSFRRTSATPAPLRSPHPKTSPGPSPPTPLRSPHPKTSPTPSPLTRAGSLRYPSNRVAPSTPPGPDSSPLRRTQSIRGSPRTPLHSHNMDTLRPSKGHARKNSGSFSDQSTHSRDSSKALKPTWR